MLCEVKQEWIPQRRRLFPHEDRPTSHVRGAAREKCRQRHHGACGRGLFGPLAVPSEEGGSLRLCSTRPRRSRQRFPSWTPPSNASPTPTRRPAIPSPASHVEAAVSCSLSSAICSAPNPARVYACKVGGRAILSMAASSR